MGFSLLIKVTFLIFFLIAGFIGDSHTQISKMKGKDYQHQIKCTGKVNMLHNALLYVSKISCPALQIFLDRHKQYKKEHSTCPRKNYKIPRSYDLRKYQRVPYYRNFYQHYFRAPESKKHKYLCPYLYKRC